MAMFQAQQQPTGLFAAANAGGRQTAAATANTTAMAPQANTTSTTAPTAPAYNHTLKPSSNGLYTDLQGSQVSQAGLDSATAAFGRMADWLAKNKSSDPRYADIAQKVTGLGQRFGFDYKKALTPPTGPNTGTTSNGTNPAAAAPTGLFSLGNNMGDAATKAFNDFVNFSKNNAPSYDGVSALPTADSFSGDRQRIENELFGRAKSDLDTRYTQETDAFNQDMANKGIDIGSERYKKERELFERTRNQAYTDARFGALTNAGEEQKRLFEMALEARKQGTTEVDNLRTSRINDLAAIMNPALKGQETINTKETSIRDDKTRRYGVDKETASRRADRKSRERDARENRKHDSSERAKDREVSREGIRARNSGDDGGFDFNQAREEFERITGKKLNG